MKHEWLIRLIHGIVYLADPIKIVADNVLQTNLNDGHVSIAQSPDQNGQSKNIIKKPVHSDPLYKQAIMRFYTGAFGGHLNKVHTYLFPTAGH